jgi:hypothetical protein
MNFRLLLYGSMFCLLTACSAKKKSSKKSNSKDKASVVKTFSVRQQSVIQDPGLLKDVVCSTQVEKQEKKEELVASGNLVDKIVCRVNGANIMYSDLEAHRIDKNGETYSLDELIAEELLWQKAVELKMVPSLTEIEQRIVSIKQANGILDISEAEFKGWLKKESGLTPRALQHQLLRIGAATHVKAWNAQESSLVSEKEKEEYYKNHTFKTDASYHLNVAFLDEAQKDTFDITKTDDLDWADVGWIAEHELSPVMKGITTLKQGEILSPVKVDYGYQVVQCIEKKDAAVKTYDESAFEIEKKLLRKKQKKADQKLIEKLRERASIIMLVK